MLCAFAMVSLSFFLARDLFLNALGVDWYEVLNDLGSSLMMMLSLVLCDILVRIWEVTSLQYDRWRILFWSFSDHGLLCKYVLSFFTENSAPLVIVMSRLFIYFMFDSFKLLLYILFCISLDFSIAFLEEMYSMSTCLYWDTFLGVLMIEVYFESEEGQWMDCGGSGRCLRPSLVLCGQMSWLSRRKGFRILGWICICC